MADDTTTNTWSLGAERVSIEDPLLECLVIIARDNGRRTSVAALSSGLPLSKEGFATPALFVRAAERINMSARLSQRPLEEVLRSPALPCILVLKGQQACILKGIKKEGVELIFPETPGDITLLPLKKINQLYEGYAFFVSGQANLDERLGPQPAKAEKNWFWSAIKRHKSIYRQVFLAAIMINIFALVSPIFIMNVYDRVLPNQAFETLWVLAIGASLAMVFDFMLKNLRAHFLDAAGRKADVQISSRIFEHILAMKMSSRPPSSGALASNMREFETLRDFFTSATIVTLVDFPFICLFLFLIWLVGGPIVAVPLALVALIISVGLLLQKPLAKMVQKNTFEGSYKSSLLIETLNGLETIKTQASEGSSQRRWEEVVEQSSLSSVKARSIASLGTSFTALAAGLSSIGIVVYGTYLVSDGIVTTGALIACVILSSRVMAPLAQVAGILTKFNQSKTALERLNELMELPVEREAEKSFISKPVIKGDVTFRDVTFRYPNQKNDQIKKLSMTLNAGNCVGVIGSVGSGKTTLLRLMTNLYQPDDGAVEVDDLDVRQIEPGDLRRNIGVAQQDAHLFYGTVRDNIVLGHENVPDEFVIRAAELSGVTAFMKGSPLGLDTPVGERGEYLSGGQRQAIAIARSLLYNPPILILDEPTASIDPMSEKLLYDRLIEICKNKTVFLITHKASLLGLVDKIALMDAGQIMDFGDRDTIIKKLQGGQYQAKPKKKTAGKETKNDKK